MPSPFTEPDRRAHNTPPAFFPHPPSVADEVRELRHAIEELTRRLQPLESACIITGEEAKAIYRRVLMGEQHHAG